MNKSFEDKIRDRLGDYRVDPPVRFRDAILNAPGSGELWLVRFFHAFGAALMLISLFMVGHIPVKERTELAFGNESRLSGQAGDDFNTPSLSEPETAHLGKETEEERMVPETAPFSVPTVHDAPKTPLTPTEKKNKGSYYEHDQEIFQTLALEKLAAEAGEEPVNPRWMSLPKEDEVIFKKERSLFAPYFEGGAFFLYNRIKPNIDDDIYVSDYDAPFGLSASRVGFSLHAGLQRDWSERFATRLGVGFNYYNQYFSFNVRSTTPQTVVVESDFVTPVYEIQAVQIQKRVSTLGMRIQNIWSFPSRYNSLFTSVEYQRIISSLPTFDYGGEKHTLVTPNQYLLEFGLRKLLFEGNRGLVYVTPALKYSMTKFKDREIIAVKPFCVGVSVSYGLK